ncbi:MAG TPA: 3-isopropylmalate dehydratase small subunit [Desulfopila sp.]|nr:3-isopropylmalate dehydratase small subunit [Desulfopila sp.]
MKKFGGPAVFLDRSDINTDEIIPAKYLTEISKTALQPHLLEDLLIDGRPFAHDSTVMQQAEVIVSRRNFGCGSSREHAVWAFEVNDINLIIAESFARIFRQNMFNCGILAVELPARDIDALFAMKGAVTIDVDLDGSALTAGSSATEDQMKCGFSLNSFDRKLIAAGGWLAYADQKY